MPELKKQYPFPVIEPKWQRFWLENKTFSAKEPEIGNRQDAKSAKQKLYVLDMFPYPSGAGLHVGHPEGYTATDIYCRFKRMQGFNVLHPMGWDAFGLPAEQYAIDTGTHPADTTKKNIDTFRRQIQKLGFSYDWEREVNTTDPEYYKWTQWIFLQLFNSYYDRHLKKAMPISLMEDAYSDHPKRESEWKDNSYLKMRRQQARGKGQDIKRWIAAERLAHEAEVPVWWCEGCKAVLANEEIRSDGTCDRKGHKEVYRRPLRQWILRITRYADRLLDELEVVSWPESIKEQQRNWIGKSNGANVEFEIEGRHFKVGVFTTRPDTLYGATYLVISPESPQVDLVTTPERRKAVDEYRAEAARKSELERTDLAKEKTGVFIGAYAINPVNNERIPIWIADYVLMGYGTGAIMGVPAHDERDWEFAAKHDIEIRVVVRTKNQRYCNRFPISLMAEDINLFSEKPSDVEERNAGPYKGTWFDFPNHKSAEDFFRNRNYDIGGIVPSPSIADGASLNSPVIDGLPTSQAKEQITLWLEERGLGKSAVNYKLRDWLFSRQRYWGEPIPIVHCDKCGVVAIPENELPLRLPEMKDYTPTGNAEPPLAKATDWVNTKCPQCGGAAKRETNTMPQWAGSCWYYLRYLDSKNDREFCSREKENYWAGRFEPQSSQRTQRTEESQTSATSESSVAKNSALVDLYVGGAEHAVLHLLYARFWHKVLFDLGHVSTPEPFMRLVNQGMILGEDGQKMSKSRGNVINPDDVVREYGADAFRMFEMFMGPLEMVKPWSMTGVEGVYRFLGRVWRLFVDAQSDIQYQQEVAAGTRKTGDFSCFIISSSIQDIEPTAEQLKLLHKTIKKVTKDLESLSFNTAISQMMIFVNETNKMIVAGTPLPRQMAEQFILLFSPFAPHLCEELWTMTGHKQTLAYEPWPQWDGRYLIEDTMTIILQVNGKVRDKLTVPADADEAVLRKLAETSEKVKSFTEGKAIRKVIVVPKKLVNVVTG